MKCLHKDVIKKFVFKASLPVFRAPRLDSYVSLWVYLASRSAPQEGSWWLWLMSCKPFLKQMFDPFTSLIPGAFWACAWYSAFFLEPAGFPEGAADIQPLCSRMGQVEGRIMTYCIVHYSKKRWEATLWVLLRGGVDEMGEKASVILVWLLCVSVFLALTVSKNFSFMMHPYDSVPCRSEFTHVLLWPVSCGIKPTNSVSFTNSSQGAKALWKT